MSLAKRKPEIHGSDPSGDAPEPSGFADLLTAATGEKYAFCKDRIVLRPTAGSEIIACRALAEAEIFSGLIDRFAVQFADADRRAIVSMWTLHYFSILTIAVAIAGLELRRKLPVSLDEMSVCVDPLTATPQAFLIPHLGPKIEPMSIEQVLQATLSQHCAPLIEALARNAGLGRKLLWTNVAAYLDWIIQEIGKSRPADHPAAAAAASYKAEIWAGGWKKPTHGLIRQQCSNDGEQYGRRQVCCLRYALPGVGGCGLSCPLPQGQA